MIMEINKSLCLSSRPWIIPLHCDFFEKEENFLFTGTNKWIALAVGWSIKYFFCQEFANISDKAGRKTRRRKHTCKALCVSCKSSNILLCVIWLARKYRWTCATTTIENINIYLYRMLLRLVLYVILLWPSKI